MDKNPKNCLRTWRGSLSVGTYPYDPILISCSKCGRNGRYRRATLVERFGESAPMPDVLIGLAACDRYRNMQDPCSAIFPDLVKSVSCSD